MHEKSPAHAGPYSSEADGTRTRDHLLDRRGPFGAPQGGDRGGLSMCPKFVRQRAGHRSTSMAAFEFDANGAIAFRRTAPGSSRNDRSLCPDYVQAMCIRACWSICVRAKFFHPQLSEIIAIASAFGILSCQAHRDRVRNHAVQDGAASIGIVIACAKRQCRTVSIKRRIIRPDVQRARCSIASEKSALGPAKNFNCADIQEITQNRTRAGIVDLVDENTDRGFNACIADRTNTADLDACIGQLAGTRQQEIW